MNKGEVWIVELPLKKGKEQRGTRPALILADTKTDLIIVIPLTSNLQALRFPYTIEIKKSNKNNLDENSVALLFQVQSIDKRRLIKKIGIVEENYLNEIDEHLKSLIKL